MESSSCLEDQMDLPPGFRFHPTDEELITHYLSPKVVDSNFCARAVAEVDLNKVEPWELPWKAKMGEKEWYFFCIKDRKYPTGTRTNRATEAGYWKATGKDKEILKEKSLVGMKKTLVFYKGRAPKGEKSNWVMHEYRLEGKLRENLPRNANNEWVLSRIFKKCSGGKKIHISGLTRVNNCGDYLGNSNLPPLLDVSTSEFQTKASLGESSHVSCFSNQMEDQKPLVNVFDRNINMSNNSLLNNCSMGFPQMMPIGESFQYMDSSIMQDQSILRLLLDNDERGIKGNPKGEFSHDTGGISTDLSSTLSNHEVDLMPYHNQDFTISSTGPMDMDCLWGF
ncbi:hypothetical protein LIER_36725 [Lithospermum erythrorhizon]|uniref:NAC domain-containing protein n=1 Tax=Lithospermum erythrorhizon TaxID=34254 RepID=A0AAV3P9T1_LITER